MTYQIPYQNSKLDKAMSQDQFNQVVEAILEGKYSWACVLILRFAGYNPLHYIPYRTYHRLLKESCQSGKLSQPQTDNIKAKNQPAQSLPKGSATTGSLSQFKDLAYLEVIDKQPNHIRGGNSSPWIEWTKQESASLQNESLTVQEAESFLTSWDLSL